MVKYTYSIISDMHLANLSLDSGVLLWCSCKHTNNCSVTSQQELIHQQQKLQCKCNALWPVFYKMVKNFPLACYNQDLDGPLTKVCLTLWEHATMLALLSGAIPITQLWCCWSILVYIIPIDVSVLQNWPHSFHFKDVIMLMSKLIFHFSFTLSLTGRPLSEQSCIPQQCENSSSSIWLQPILFV